MDKTLHMIDNYINKYAQKLDSQVIAYYNSQI